MAEINLPTKTMQDSIKGDTTSILNQLPSIAGTDFSKLKPILSGYSTEATTKSMVLSVTGKGMIHSIMPDRNDMIHITIDGVPLMRNNELWSVQSGETISLLIPFNKSFVIKGMDNYSAYHRVLYSIY